MSATIPFLGGTEILGQHPRAAPNKLKRAPAPLVHAASRKTRREFYRIYAAFVGAFYEAVERLKAGIRDPPSMRGTLPARFLEELGYELERVLQAHSEEALRRSFVVDDDVMASVGAR